MASSMVVPARNAASRCAIPAFRSASASLRTRYASPPSACSCALEVTILAHSAVMLDLTLPRPPTGTGLAGKNWGFSPVIPAPAMALSIPARSFALGPGSPGCPSSPSTTRRFSADSRSGPIESLISCALPSGSAEAVPSNALLLSASLSLIPVEAPASLAASSSAFSAFAASSSALALSVAAWASSRARNPSAFSVRAAWSSAFCCIACA